MNESRILPTPLEEGLYYLQQGDLVRAEESFRRSAPCTERDLGLAEARLGSQSGAEEAYKILLERFLADEEPKPPELRRRMLRLLRQAAQAVDPEMEKLLNGFPAEHTKNKNSVLKAFYCRCPNGNDGATLWEKVRDAQREIGMRHDRTIAPEGYTIQFAKTFSSVTPLMDLSPDGAAGGGYFLNLGGYGCVIDPGYGFLNNFYQLETHHRRHRLCHRYPLS